MGRVWGSDRPWSSLVEGDEQLDRPNSQTWWNDAKHRLHIFGGFHLNTTAYHLGRYSIHLHGSPQQSFFTFPSQTYFYFPRNSPNHKIAFTNVMKKEVRKNILRQLYLRLEPVQLWSGVERANHDATRNIVRFLNGCVTVGRVVACNTRGPTFKYRQWRFVKNIYSWLKEKPKIKIQNGPFCNKTLQDFVRSGST